MNSIEDYQFDLFLLYFHYKISKLSTKNSKNEKILGFLNAVSNLAETFTPRKIQLLEKRFLKK